MKNIKLNLEYLRVVAIICTIMVHVSNIYFYNFGNISNTDFLISTLFNSIGRICVPLFFMISGALLLTESFDKTKNKKRIIKTIIIIVIWSLVYVLINNNYKGNIIQIIIYSFFNVSKTQGHLWYLYALLGIYISLPFILSMVINLKRNEENLFVKLWLVFSGLIVIITPLCRFLTNSKIDVIYPIPIINATYYLGYFVLGYIIFKRLSIKKGYEKYNILCISIFIISTFITALVTYVISINNNYLFQSMMWYRSIFIIFSSASIFTLFIINENKFKNNIITVLSKHTFGVYLIHMIFLLLLKKNINFFNYSSIYIIPASTIIIYILSVFSTYIIKKIPVIKKII